SDCSIRDKVKLDFLSPAEPTGSNGAAYPPFDRQPFAVDSIWTRTLFSRTQWELDPLCASFVSRRMTASPTRTATTIDNKVEEICSRFFAVRRSEERRVGK